MSNLQEEIDTYIRHLPELLRHQGKFVLIKGAEIAGIFDSYQDALTAGYQRFKRARFLVKQIVAVERVDRLPRMLRRPMDVGRRGARSILVLKWTVPRFGHRVWSRRLIVASSKSGGGR